MPTSVKAFFDQKVPAALATVVIGGLLSATVLELLTLPVILWWIVGRNAPDLEEA